MGYGVGLAIGIPLMFCTELSLAGDRNVQLPYHQRPVFCLLLGVSSDYAQPITSQVTEVTCPVIG